MTWTISPSLLPAIVPTVFLALGAIGPSRAVAGPGGMTHEIAAEDLIVDTDADVYLVTVSQVSKHRATRANPPQVVLRIDETIRGAARKSLRTVWDTPFDPELNVINGGGLTEARRRELRDYAREPLQNPGVGENWLIVLESWPDGAPAILHIAAKFPFSNERRGWIDDQLKLRQRYDAERNQHRELWPAPLALWGNQLPAGARPVTGETALQSGTPVLVKYATTTQCHVVEVLENGRVKVRPNGYDSRRDDIVLRVRLMLYPASPPNAQQDVPPDASKRNACGSVRN